MNKHLTILYIGSLANWCNSLRRYKALKEIAPLTDSLNTDPYILPKFISGIQHHFNFGPGVVLLNRKIRRLVQEKRYDIVIVDNKPYLSRNTLRYIKLRNGETKIVNIITDDPFGKFSRSWPLLKKTVAFYDLFFVQRKINIEELKGRGAKRVELCYRSFDPEYNRPLSLSEEDFRKYDCHVGFVGTYENVRASFVAYLIQNGIAVSVIGNDWPEGEYWDIIKPYYRGPSVYEEEYVKAINGMEIALHFLRHCNRDEQDSRTFEIPASKVFMIAERSALHAQLFKENEEAVFFSSKEELLEKVKYYLENPEEAKRIAHNGYARCYESKYDHRSRMKYILEVALLRINSDVEAEIK